MISPCLANVYLHALDRAWEQRWSRLGKLTRYADDLVILSWNERQARRALEVLGGFSPSLGSSSHP